MRFCAVACEFFSPIGHWPLACITVLSPSAINPRRIPSSPYAPFHPLCFVLFSPASCVSVGFAAVSAFDPFISFIFACRNILAFSSSTAVTHCYITRLSITLQLTVSHTLSTRPYLRSQLTTRPIDSSWQLFVQPFFNTSRLSQAGRRH